MKDQAFSEENIVIKPAQSEDAEAITHIQADTWLATYPNKEHGITEEDIRAKKLDDPARTERWRQRIETPTMGQMIWIAKEKDRVIGFCFVKKGDTENYIEALYVYPNEQRKGAGQKLMHEALNWLGPHKKIGLGVTTYNQQAMKFYQKLGFEISDEPPESVPSLPSGLTMPVIKMVRSAGRLHL